MRLLLDTNVLSRLCHPTSHRDVQDWFRGLLVHRPAPPDILVSVLADYELRRNLLRLGASASLARLDIIAQSVAYLPVTFETTLKASKLWAELRANIPHGHNFTLSDADILMATHAAVEGAVLVTSDAQLRQIPDIEVRDWHEVVLS